eukprot:8114909-Pyramimonas_sp.AAC.1
MIESGRVGVCGHVGCMSPPHSETPRVVEGVCSLIRGIVVGHGCPDWKSVDGWGSYQVSSYQLRGGQ